MKISVPIEVEFDNMKSLLEDIGRLQTYKLHEGDDMTLVDVDDVVNILAKHIKAKERKTGRWIDKQKVYSDLSIATCSCCGLRLAIGRFCPHCGAKMKGND